MVPHMLIPCSAIRTPRSAANINHGVVCVLNNQRVTDKVAAAADHCGEVHKQMLYCVLHIHVRALTSSVQLTNAHHNFD